MRILVIEDEKKVANFIRAGLGEEGYAVDVAYDGIEGEYLATVNDYDAIVLDLLLPKKGGMEVLKTIRGNKNTAPVLLLTAIDIVENKVKGLDIGADDYLVKPFSYDEFLARIRALLRRKGMGLSSLEFSDLRLDRATRKAYRDKKEIELTAKEYGLLEYMLRNPNRVITRTMIIEHVWEYDFDSQTNVVDVYVNHLRSKIDKGFTKKLIHTIRGMGYVLKE
ncbi:MAG: response regulator transcription factor [Deltaproteobacteria bacterium]|nr:response regulator transcription factor [Deltaproteobacteria bacterium]